MARFDESIQQISDDEARNSRTIKCNVNYPTDAAKQRK